MTRLRYSLIPLTLLILAGPRAAGAQTPNADVKTGGETATQTAAVSSKGEKAGVVGADREKDAARPPAKKSEDDDRPTGFGRWVELQATTVGLRFRHVANSAGVTTTRQLQHQEAFKGRFKFDAAGRYSLHAGVFTGDSFTGSWNNTGAGTGEAAGRLRLKQLYFSAQPFRGIEAQYGGLYVARGESSEITTYDNDAYVTGQRLTFKRPRQLFFDEVTVTYAYLGDVNEPSLFRRWRRLGESNYHQFLVSKKVGKRLGLSADYTFLNGAETLRQAVKVNARELRVVDSVRFENYQRVDVRPDYGFALSGEKKLTKRLTLGGGYADVDPNYGGLNADRFNKGRRVFATGSFALTPELTASAFAGRGVANDFAVSNRTRVDFILSYDLLNAVRRARLMR
jgi:hypothetical protein